MRDINWEKLKRPPEWALKKITGGRLSGMTDIKPQWRIQVMNDVFGPCGEGWKFTIADLNVTDGSDGQKFAFVLINLYYKVGESDWSDPIPGQGGSMLVAKEKSGLHNNDEAFKMAITDALSSAMKMIGVAEDVYMGNWTGSKYIERLEEKQITSDQAMDIAAEPALNKAQLIADYKMLCSGKGMTKNDITDFENTVCNSKKESDFKKLMPMVVKKFEKTYSWWMEKRLT